MSARHPEFALVPITQLHAHERIDGRDVVKLAAKIRNEGMVSDPVWVARGSLVVLNGHHRVAALRRLGAARVPAWIFDYDAEIVRLGRWSPGPEISKSEVVRRAKGGELYPPKTTRHEIGVELPHRPTPLAELMPDARARGYRSSEPSRGRDAGAPGAE